MNKTELTDAVSQQAGVSKAEAKRVIEATLQSIENSLSRGEEVTLTGFGTFDVSHRSARTGRNPQSGAPIEIPEMDVPRFRAGKQLKEAVK